MLTDDFSEGVFGLFRLCFKQLLGACGVDFSLCNAFVIRRGLIAVNPAYKVAGIFGIDSLFSADGFKQTLFLLFIF